YKDDNATAFYNLAWSANELNEYADAAGAESMSISLQEGYLEACVELVYAKQKLNSPDEAIAAYQEAIRQKPNYGLAYTGLGDLYYVDSKPRRCQDAVAAYQKTAAIS